MNKKILFLLFSLLSLFSFLLLSKYEDRVVVRTLDFAVSVRVQDAITKHCPVRCDSVLSGASELAGPFVGSLVVLALTGFLFYDRSTKRIHMWAFLIPIFFIIMTLIEVYGKNVVAHPAPPFFMIKHPTAIFPTYHVSAEYSYPSGHAARAVYVSVLFLVAWVTHAIRAKMKQRHAFFLASALIIFVSLVSLGKIYLGHHWFSDILGGTFLALSFAFGALVFAPVDVHAKADYNRKVHE